MNHKVISKVYGVPINYDRSPKDYFNWDGTQVNAKGLPEHDLLHEIAHYIMSPNKYRKYINFYLGYGPDENPFIYNKTMEQLNPNKPLAREEAQEEEELTCPLEFIFASMYQDLDTVKSTMQNRQYMQQKNNKFEWSSSSDPANLFAKIIQLQNKKIIDKNWVPVALKKNKVVNSSHLSNLFKFRNEVMKAI